MRYLSLGLSFATIGLLLCSSCDSSDGTMPSKPDSHAGDAAADASSEPDAGESAQLDDDDFASSWMRMPLPSTEELGDRESLVVTDAGFAVLYRKQLGSGKVVEGTENRVFTSSDGVQWDEHSVPLADTASFYRAMAFGHGGLLLAGARGLAGITAFSNDAANWTSGPGLEDAAHALAFANGAFYALGTRMAIARSVDGTDWDATNTETAQLSALAYGNGIYVAVGSGPIERSEDGMDWQAVELDCSIGGNCVTDPSGGVHQGYISAVFFAYGKFYAQGLESEDGQSWERQPDSELIPTGAFGGYLMRIEDDVLQAWKPDETPDETTARAVALAEHDGMASCEGARCFILANQLVRVP